MNDNENAKARDTAQLLADAVATAIGTHARKGEGKTETGKLIATLRELAVSSVKDGIAPKAIADLFGDDVEAAKVPAGTVRTYRIALEGYALAVQDAKASALEAIEAGEMEGDESDAERVAVAAIMHGGGKAGSKDKPQPKEFAISYRMTHPNYETPDARAERETREERERDAASIAKRVKYAASVEYAATKEGKANGTDWLALHAALSALLPLLPDAVTVTGNAKTETKADKLAREARERAAVRRAALFGNKEQESEADGDGDTGEAPMPQVVNG